MHRFQYIREAIYRSERFVGLVRWGQSVLYKMQSVSEQVITHLTERLFHFCYDIKCSPTYFYYSVERLFTLVQYISSHMPISPAMEMPSEWSAVSNGAYKMMFSVKAIMTI